jgi:hypothetical protein
MITNIRPLVEINQQAIQLLYKQLGVVDTVRFLKQFTLNFPIQQLATRPLWMV